MSRVNVLVEARDSLSVKFLEFTRVTSKGKYAVFFEGEDEKYYSIRINTIRPDIKWSSINSGGKAKVLGLRKKIRAHETYRDAACLFFVDADFDDNSNLSIFDDIYVTPCYSVENLYISTDAYSRVLSAEFGINDSKENESCYANSLSIFEKIKAEYIKAIKPFNSLIRELRLMENRGDLEGRLNINNLKFEDLIRIDLNVVEKAYDEENPKSIFPELDEAISVDLNNSEHYFSNISGELWFRGKQNLEFFRVFLTKIKEDRVSKNSRQIFKDKGSVKLQMSKGNFISELSQYADTPQCLKEFLEMQNVA